MKLLDLAIIILSLWYAYAGFRRGRSEFTQLMVLVASLVATVVAWRVWIGDLMPPESGMLRGFTCLLLLAGLNLLAGFVTALVRKVRPPVQGGRVLGVISGLLRFSVLVIFFVFVLVHMLQKSADDDLLLKRSVILKTAAPVAAYLHKAAEKQPVQTDPVDPE